MEYTAHHRTQLHDPYRQSPSFYGDPFNIGVPHQPRFLQFPHDQRRRFRGHPYRRARFPAGPANRAIYIPPGQRAESSPRPRLGPYRLGHHRDRLPLRQGVLPGYRSSHRRGTLVPLRFTLNPTRLTPPSLPRRRQRRPRRVTFLQHGLAAGEAHARPTVRLSAHHGHSSRF